MAQTEILNIDNLRAGNQLINDASFAITDAILGAQSLGDALVQTFARAGESILQSGILNLLSGGTQGTSFGSVFSAFGSLFGGARANGGPISAGRAYLVGERGPELVVPRADGMVIPNGALGGGVAQQFDLRGAVVTEQLYAQMRAIGAQAAQAGAVGGAALARQQSTREARRRL
jgi:hypothetical protein